MRIRKLLISVLTLAVAVCMETSGFCGSPNTANGIGSIIPDDIGRSKGMGGAGIADDESMNLLRDNPALLSTFDTYSFSFGAIYSHTKTYIRDEENPVSGKINHEIIKIVIPFVKGIKIGWGLSPYSKTDVNILLEDEQNGVRIIDRMSSTGGINVSSLGIAGSYKNIIRVGFSFNYNFGMIQEEWNREFPDNDEFVESRYYIKKKYKGYGKTVGILANIYKNTVIGIGYTTKSDLNQDTYIQPELLSNPEKLLNTRKASLPESWRFGISSELRDRLKAGMDIKIEKWENAAREPKEKDMYNDTYRFGIGVRYIPTDRLGASYFKKLPLSLGFKFGTLYYKSFYKNNPQYTDTIFEKAVTFGIEFPLMRNAGNLITSFEYGVRGDKNKNGWDENFMAIGVSLIGRIK